MADLTTRPVADQEWDDLVRQLHNQPKTGVRPFFYARVQARLAANAAAQSHALPGWLRRPAYAALLGALVMTLSGDGAARRPAAAARCQDCPGARPQPR